MESRLGSQPTTARRGVPSEVGATSACISTSRGRLPSMPAKTAVPGLPRSRSERKSSDGLAISLKPVPVISNTPISSVGPNRFFTARRMLNGCEPSPSNESTPSTMCSTTRGPAIWPSLVTWPTRIMAAPERLAKRISACAEPRDDVLDRGFGGKLDGGAGEPEALRAQPQLRHRFLAGNIDRPITGAPDGGGDLHQQRRLADPRIAAEQQHRATHKAAASNPVELGDAAGEPRRVVGFAGEGLEREQPPLARRAAGHRRARGRRCFLGNGVPIAAGVALALPPGIGGAAVLADEARFAAGHDDCSRINCSCRPADSGAQD